MAEISPSENKVPKHIGIILDGNRRFSKRLMMKPWKGHEWGAKKVEKLLDWCKEIGIKELTLYTFSVENFNRPKEEFDYLMNLFRREFEKLKDDKRIDENRIRINVIGRIWMFPKDIQERMRYIMEKTKNYDNYIINFAMGYGGRAEVVDAAKKIAQQVKDGKLDIEQINEETFSRNLYMADEPDLIIRTGGDHRTSNFLNYQAAYSEWIFLEKTWPEFEKEDLVEAISDFSKRERRFGR
jgi:tritrans,polycis-undecaprenyl-diphosphate synthase [geranylgeranyl-diphosphate specific]